MTKARKFHLALYTMLPVTHHSMATWKDPHNMTRGFQFDRPENDIIKHAHVEAVHAFGDAVKQAGNASPEREGNWAKSTFEDLVQYNDGFKTNLIGTPRQIAERIVALKAVGVDLILTGFLHFIEEVEYFGQKVLPIVRELEAAAQKAQQAEPALEAAA